MKQMTCKLRHLMLGMTAVIMAVLTSCSSGNGELIELIPAKMDYVGVFNLKKFAVESGIELKDNDFMLPDGLSQYDDQIPDEMRDIICTIMQSIDIEHIAMFGKIPLGTSSTDFYVLTKVTDQKKLTDLLENEAGLDADKEDGATVYNLGYGGIVIRDGMVWLTTSGKNPGRAIERIIDKAKDRSMADESTIARILSSDNITCYAYRLEALADMGSMLASIQPEFAAASAALKGLKDCWMVSTGDIKDKVSTSETRLITTDGKILENPYARNIDPSFLSYVPEDFYSSAALGISPEVVKNLLEVTDKFSKNMNDSEKQMYKQIASFVEDIDGTLSLSIGIPTDKAITKIEPEDIRFIASLQFKPGKAKAILSELTDMLKQESAGDTSITYSADRIEANIPMGYRKSMHITLKAENDMLILANVPLNAGKSNSAFASYFNDATAGVVINVPSFAALTEGNCRFGAILESHLTDNALKGMFKFIDSDLTLAGSIYELGYAFYRTFEADRKNRFSDYTYNDYDDIVVEEVAEVVEEVVEADTIANFY